MINTMIYKIDIMILLELRLIGENKYEQSI